MGMCAAQGFHAIGQEVWTLDRCMVYAVEHAHQVQMKRIEADNALLSLERTRDAFIPAVSAGVGGQVSWGRNVDPETNTYNTITTLNNSYQLSTGVTLWSGMQQINALKQAHLQMRQSRNALQEGKDQVAMETMNRFIDAVYAMQSAELARQKKDDSSRMLEKTRRLEELGEKGMPEVAQMEAQLANDTYEAVRQQHAADKARHALKTIMNYPAEDSIVLGVEAEDTLVHIDGNARHLFPIPALVAAENNVALQRYNYRITRGRLSPTLSLGTGIGTSYFRNLSTRTAVNTFGKQWKNNMGEYVSASLSIPLLNLTTHKDIRRARNQVRLAEVARQETQFRTRETYRQTCDDVNGSRKELQLMHAKVKSDSIAHHMNCRKFEEGLLSALDLQTSAQALHQSRIRLLQVALTLNMQQRVKQYYETGKIYNEEYGQKD